jgi:hypothetical protein
MMMSGKWRLKGPSSKFRKFKGTRDLEKVSVMMAKKTGDELIFTINIKARLRMR